MGPHREEISAHIALVSARSVWLRQKIREVKALDSDSNDRKTGLTVDLADADPRAFALVLDFIYTDMIDPTKGKK